METKSAKIRSALKDDTGLTTTEYAVGTIAVAGLSGVLLKLLISDNVRDLLWSVIKGAFSRFFG
jgi:Flp pilus assembly pilin Flp